MVKAMGVTVYYIHMGNQTSVFWRQVNTFVLWKMKIFLCQFKFRMAPGIATLKKKEKKYTVHAHAQEQRLLSVVEYLSLLRSSSHTKLIF